MVVTKVYYKCYFRVIPSMTQKLPRAQHFLRPYCPSYTSQSRRKLTMSRIYSSGFKAFDHGMRRLAPSKPTRFARIRRGRPIRPLGPSPLYSLGFAGQDCNLESKQPRVSNLAKCYRLLALRDLCQSTSLTVQCCFCCECDAAASNSASAAVLFHSTSCGT